MSPRLVAVAGVVVFVALVVLIVALQPNASDEPSCAPVSTPCWPGRRPAPATEMGT